jgi:hypothetical protein
LPEKVFKTIFYVLFVTLKRKDFLLIKKEGSIMVKDGYANND